MSSNLELHPLSNKLRPSSTPPVAPPDGGPVPLTHPEESGEGTTASWAWAASTMFVARVHRSRDILIILNPTPRSSLLAWSCALIFVPRVLLFAIGQSQQLTPLESFLVLHFGLLLAFSALGLVVNVISILSFGDNLRN